VLDVSKLNFIWLRFFRSSFLQIAQIFRSNFLQIAQIFRVALKLQGWSFQSLHSGVVVNLLIFKYH
jgi:hypothetical protein